MPAPEAAPLQGPGGQHADGPASLQEAAPRRHPDALRRTDAARLRAEFACVIGAGLGMALGLYGDAAGVPAARAAGYAAAYGLGGWYGARAGLQALRRVRLEIDGLMVLAAAGALAIGAPFEGGLLLFLFALSNALQGLAVGRSRRAIESLMTLRPDTARLQQGDRWVEVPVGEVVQGDVYAVRPGDRLPLDGLVLQGLSEIDQSALTGESVPVERGPGEAVFAGTVNGSGHLQVRVTQRAADSTLARMIALVEEAQAERAQTQRLVDRLEGPYVLGVVVLTVAAAVVPPVFLGEAVSPSVYRAITLMVAASPCAVVLATPAAVLSAIAAAARNGVLFKGGVHVEEAATVRAVAFDKTGTLTQGATRLTRAVPLEPSLKADELLALAAAVQAFSEHHLARATVEAAREAGVQVPPATGFTSEAGRGVSAVVEGASVQIGNPGAFEGQRLDGRAEALALVETLQDRGQTAVIVARREGERLRALGVMAFADTVRPEAATAVRALKAQGVRHVALITGDNAAVARSVGEAVGADAVYAGVLPEGKVDRVRALRERYGGVAFVGDGINDAPALAAATVGIAMGGAGTDAALESADLVLMGDDLARLPFALKLARRTRRVIAASLAFALGLIVVMAVSVLTVGLPLPLAVVGHEGSTVVVALNGLRLLGARPAG